MTLLGICGDSQCHVDTLESSLQDHSDTPDSRGRLRAVSSSDTSIPLNPNTLICPSEGTLVPHASQAFASDDFAFSVTDATVSKLVSLFPATSDILPLQNVFPVIPMHLHGKWTIEHIPIVQYTDIHYLRHVIAHAKHIYIYIDGLMPFTDRLDQGLAFALVIFF